jgi:hypothetical protein
LLYLSSNINIRSKRIHPILVFFLFLFIHRNKQMENEKLPTNRIPIVKKKSEYYSFI